MVAILSDWRKRSKYKHILFWCTIALVLFAIRATQSDAFGTLNLLGQHAEHEKITRLGLADFAFGPNTLASIAGSKETFGAVGAPDRPGRGLITFKAAHCDGGDWLDSPNYPREKAEAESILEACRLWIFDNIDRAVQEAGRLLEGPAAVKLHCNFDDRQTDSAKCRVVEKLGLAFHAAQDFYSHTNWVDIPAPGPITTMNPPGLGMRSLAPWLNPRNRIERRPTGLISGCFEFLPELLFCVNRIKHAYLNKDFGDIDIINKRIGSGTTPRGKLNDNFRYAVEAAIDDTRDKWNYFEGRIKTIYGSESGDKIICLLREDAPTNCK